jgi:hypothetical protein
MKPKSARGDWTKQLRFDMAYAEKTLLKDGEVGSMFVVHAKERMHLIAAPWRDEGEKAAILDLVRAYCIAEDAAALTYLSEAWTRHMQQAPNETEAEFRARIDAVRPRDAEDRREMVLVMTMFRDDAGERQVVSDSREIERRANGKPSGLKPHRVNKGWDVLAGAIVDAFPQWPPSPAEREAACAVLNANENIADG